MLFDDEFLGFNNAIFLYIHNVCPMGKLRDIDLFICSSADDQLGSGIIDVDFFGLIAC